MSDRDGLSITYQKQDYRTLQMYQTYNLIMIYCDFGALVLSIASQKVVFHAVQP